MKDCAGLVVCCVYGVEHSTVLLSAVLNAALHFSSVRPALLCSSSDQHSAVQERSPATQTLRCSACWTSAWPSSRTCWPSGQRSRRGLQQ